MKLKNGLVREVKEQIRQEEEQKQLHKKHTEIADDTVIIEKDNMGKFLIRCIVRLIRIAAKLTICVFAAIGILSVLYPNVRAELLQVLQSVMSDIVRLMGR